MFICNNRLILISILICKLKLYSPVFSAVQWMLPLAGKLGMQFDKQTNPYATNIWHTDRCCHPRAEGHRILALVLAYCLVEEEKVLQFHGERGTLGVERDFTAAEEPLLRKPVYLSSESSRPEKRKQRR